MKDGLRLTGILIILMLVLKTQGCLPEQNETYELTPEEKLQMLINNENY